MTKIDTSLDAEIVVITASSGGGKSSIVKKKINGHKRVVIFDPDDEYGGIQGITKAESCADLLRLLKQTKGGGLKVRIVAESKTAFDFVCTAVFHWGKCAFVAEELAGRTHAGKAKGGWHTLVSRGRKRGISIYGITQRIAECDKTIVGNASEIYVGRLTRSVDRDLIAREIDMSRDLIGQLKKLKFIRADMNEGTRFAHDVKTGKEQQIPV